MPRLDLNFESDFDNLCSIADQCQSVNVDNIDYDLRQTGRAIAAAKKRKLHPSQYPFLFGDFNDLS